MADVTGYTSAMASSVLFVQKFAHRAGAQTSLIRLVSHERLRRWKPVVLCSSDGWLTQECARRQIPFLVHPFPSSRSLLARLLFNAQFATAVRERLMERSILPAIVHANDHWDATSGLHLATILKARSAVFLRTSRITRTQYFKYRCDKYDLIASIGRDLQSRVQQWDKNNQIRAAWDGLEDEEFLPPIKKPGSPPKRVLVIGAERSSKGWADLVEALRILAQRNSKLLPEQVDFTGKQPSQRENDLKLWRVPEVRFEFLGRVDDFRKLVREYSLIINSSRSDTFGLAAIETLAAGVPLVSSRTGVLGQTLTPNLLFEPGSPDSLAAVLERVLIYWAGVDFGLEAAQDCIRREWSIEQAAEIVDQYYRELTSVPATVQVMQ
jgi:glycosyltransferase involved in cell wall biosynthesis